MKAIKLIFFTVVLYSSLEAQVFFNKQPARIALVLPKDSLLNLLSNAHQLPYKNFASFISNNKVNFNFIYNLKETPTRFVSESGIHYIIKISSDYLFTTERMFLFDNLSLGDKDEINLFSLNESFNYGPIKKYNNPQVCYLTNFISSKDMYIEYYVSYETENSNASLKFICESLTPHNITNTANKVNSLQNEIISASSTFSDLHQSVNQTRTISIESCRKLELASNTISSNTCCFENAVCPSGSSITNEIRGSVKYDKVVKFNNGTYEWAGMCSGALISDINSENYFVVTAGHCIPVIQGDIVEAIHTFRFNYHTKNCINNNLERSRAFDLSDIVDYNGAIMKAHVVEGSTQNYNCYDFGLLKLNSSPNYNEFSIGWTNSTTASYNIRNMGYPDGAPLKVYDFDDNYIGMGGANINFPTFYKGSNYFVGLWSYSGFSGSPLMSKIDDKYYIRGISYGSSTTSLDCNYNPNNTNMIVNCTKFSKAWDLDLNNNTRNLAKHLAPNWTSGTISKLGQDLPSSETMNYHKYGSLNSLNNDNGIVAIAGAYNFYSNNLVFVGSKSKNGSAQLFRVPSSHTITKNGNPLELKSVVKLQAKKGIYIKPCSIIEKGSEFIAKVNPNLNRTMTDPPSDSPSSYFSCANSSATVSMINPDLNTSVKTNFTLSPSTIKLIQENGGSYIELNAKEQDYFTISFRDIVGRDLMLLLQDYREKGIYRYQIPTDLLQSGIYFITLESKSSKDFVKFKYIK